MKALILVGGEGTRLRPLTANTPKPLLPLVNRPFLDHVLFLLRAHGVNDVVLAMQYLSENFENAYGDGSHLGMNLTYVREAVPLGTGGAIKNAEEHLSGGETLLVFNGDILTDLDLSDMLRFHREKGSICSISLTPVEDPSAFGVVDTDSTGRIERFTEKPKREEATSNWINAGTYIIEPEVLEHIPAGQHYMVERGLFPSLLQAGKPLYGYRSSAYWMDIGTPAKYIQAHADILLGSMASHVDDPGEPLQEGVRAGKGCDVNPEASIRGPVVMGEGCRIEAGAAITGPVVLGDNCVARAGAYLERVVAWDGARFDVGSNASDCIVGRGATVGEASIISGVSIVGDDASVGAGNQVSHGMRLWPGVTLPDRAVTF